MQLLASATDMDPCAAGELRSYPTMTCLMVKMSYVTYKQ